MGRRILGVLGVALWAQHGLAQAAPLPSQAPAAETTGSASEPRLRHSGIQWVDPTRDIAIDALADTAISKIIFINQCVDGCTLTPGVNDARINSSSLVGSTSVITEFAHDQTVFDDVVACVREVFAPYDVDIVTEDPGQTFHHEAILAGHPSDLGLPSSIAGLAAASCEPLNNVISISFSNFGDVTVLDLCWVVAQEAAHSFGLPSHVYNCLDPMTYLDGCGQKFFRDEAYPCGEFAEGDPPCLCGGTAQNSHRELLNVFGPGGPVPPPTVNITTPTTDQEVPDQFSIFWTSLDPRLVDRSEVWVNGTRYGEVLGHDYDNRLDSYEFVTPALPDGYQEIEIRSMNDLGSTGTATVRALKGAPCADATTCFDHQECVAGACRYPPATGQLGDVCEYEQFCAEGECVAAADGNSYCANVCRPGGANACPESFDCVPESDDRGFCIPTSSGGGGGCSASHPDSPTDGPLSTLLLLGIIALATRRR